MSFQVTQMLMQKSGQRIFPPFVPSNRVHGHEEDSRQEFSGLVVLTKDVNDLPSVEGDEHVN